MKKTLLAAVLMSSAVASQATTYGVSSDITNHQLWIGFADQLSVANNPLSIKGTAEDSDDDGILDSSNVDFTGQVQFNAAGVEVRVTFDLQDGDFVNGQGITYSGGQILVETDGGVPGDPFTVFSTVDVSSENIPFTAITGGGAAVPGPQSTAGVQLPSVASLIDAPPATVQEALGGLWDGAFNGTNFNNGVSAVTLLGNTAGMYLEGDILVAPVPVPAAAWLFGSALLGMAGLKRARRKG